MCCFIISYPHFDKVRPSECLQWPPYRNAGVKNTIRLINFLSRADVPFPACSRGKGCVHLREKQYKMPSLALTSNENVISMNDMDEGLDNNVETKVSTNRSLIHVIITNKLTRGQAG